MHRQEARKNIESYENKKAAVAVVAVTSLLAGWAFTQRYQPGSFPLGLLASSAVFFACWEADTIMEKRIKNIEKELAKDDSKQFLKGL